MDDFFHRQLDYRHMGDDGNSYRNDGAIRWMQAWREAGPALERVRREELRTLDGRRAIELLTGPADYRQEPRTARPSSGLVEQQLWFMKARHRA